MTLSVSKTAVSPPRENVMALYRRIKRMILLGDLKGGAALSQVQLAQTFNTSRGPVREALRMLQQEGLIEAETNHRGRVATFSPADMERVCAMLVLNVAAATNVGQGLFSSQDIEQIDHTINRIERLADAGGSETPIAARRIVARQLAFRKLITILCKYSGAYSTQIIDDLLDRLALFRQMHELMGVSPPYPLASRFTELRSASQLGDANQMAAIAVEKIADVSRKALLFVADDYQPVLLDAYIQMAQKITNNMSEMGGDAIDSEDSGVSSVTIRVNALPNSKIECVITQE